MLVDSLLAIDVLLIYLYAQYKSLRKDSTADGYFVKLKFLTMLRVFLLLVSCVPFLIHFTRKTIKKIAVFRILADVALIGATVYYFYLEMVPTIYNEMI